MREKILLRIGSRKFHLFKVIGALILIGSGLMILNSVYNFISIASILIGPTGQSVVLEFGSLTMYGEVGGLESSMKIGLLLSPLAGIVFWSAIFVLGFFIYNSSGIFIPLTETIMKVAEEDSKVEDDKKTEDDGSKDKKERSRSRYIEARDGFVCPKCGKSFDSERGLHIHQSRVH